MQQNVIQGIDMLPQILKDINCKKLFLVAGSSFLSLDIKDVVETLDVEIVLFSGFTPNPLYEQVCNGIELFKESQCDTILAIGGGSAIDVAKCIKHAVVCDYVKLPFIAIPTTAGSGSESTHNAVMYYEGVKQTVTNDAILPDYALLEPSVLRNLPLYQKKCTMMDALCQGIESWWSVNSNEESYEYSRKSIELIMANWEKYIFEDDLEAAAQIMLGANYSGKAINIAQTTAAHAMSYKITSLYKLPHGHAVAVCLPEIWKYMISNINQCKDERGAEYLEEIFNSIANAMGAATPMAAIELFRNVMKKMDLKHPVTNRRESELAILVKSVNPVRLKNNPISLSEDTIKGIYSIILRE